MLDNLQELIVSSTKDLNDQSISNICTPMYVLKEIDCSDLRN